MIFRYINPKVWALVCMLAVAVTCSSAQTNILDVKDFGAVGDGKTSDTTAIQQAIDECSRLGGGCVEVPAGQFVSGTILLADNVTFRLATNAALLGSLDIADYRNIDPFTSGNGAAFGDCLIGAVNARNVGIAGAGMIDGRGKQLLAARPKGNTARPMLVRFVRCDGVRVNEVSLQSPAAWTMHFSQSTNIQANGVKITSLGLGNNDGMDIDSCRGVTIRDCNIDSGDDAICLKTTGINPCRDVTVADCTLKSHWAAVKFGTESVGGFENITVTNCRIRGAQGGGIKLCSVDGANVKNVFISDLTMDDVTVPIFMRLGARLKTFRTGDPKQPVGTMRNITIQNVTAQATWPVGIFLNGIPGHPIENLTFSNLAIHLPGGGTEADTALKLEEKESAYPEISMFGKKFPASGLFARHINGMTLSDVRLDLAAADVRPLIYIEDAANLAFADWKVLGNADAGFAVHFDSVHKAVFNGFGKLRPEIQGQANSEILITAP